MKTVRLMSAVVLMVVSGCSGYRLASQTKSVVVDKVSPNAFRLDFCSDAYTSQEAAEKAALRRAAEVTLSKGYGYFAVLNAKGNARLCQLATRGYTQEEPVMPGTEARGADALVESSITGPNISLTIQCFSRGKKIPEGAFDAREVLRGNYQGGLK